MELRVMDEFGNKTVVNVDAWLIDTPPFVHPNMLRLIDYAKENNYAVCKFSDWLAEKKFCGAKALYGKIIRESPRAFLIEFLHTYLIIKKGVEEIQKRLEKARRKLIKISSLPGGDFYVVTKEEWVPKSAVTIAPLLDKK